MNFAACKTLETFREAVEGPDSTKWVKAISEELQAHKRNNTWTLVQKNDNMRLIDTKWVFKIVRGKTGDTKRYKARLCARGFLQQYGIDYNETFSPVVRYDSLRMFLAHVTREDLELVQFDVCAAFLYGELKKRSS